MYDIVIIGAGPAGLTAGIYGAMANKQILILEKTYVGGQVASIYKIKNYPGFEEIDGAELSFKMRKQAENLGVKILNEEVKNVSLKGDVKTITTYKNSYSAKCVILATGAYAKSLDVANEKFYIGKGLSYCATCDGNFFKDKTVAVVGGGNTSLEDCIYLSNIAKKVYLIHRREGFRGNELTLSKIRQMSLCENARVEVLTNCVVTALNGDDKLTGIKVLNKQQNKEFDLKVDGVFVAIGRMPDTELFADEIELNEKGFVKTNFKMQTNLDNVYAVGDVRDTPLRQIVTACADGAIAVNDFVSK